MPWPSIRNIWDDHLQLRSFCISESWSHHFQGDQVEWPKGTEHQGPAWSRLVVTLFGATTWKAFHCFEKRSHFKKAIHVASNVVDISAIIEDVEILAQFGTWCTLNWCHLTLRTFEKCVQQLVLIPGRHLIWKHLRSSFNGHENHDHNMEQS